MSRRSVTAIEAARTYPAATALGKVPKLPAALHMRAAILASATEPVHARLIAAERTAWETHGLRDPETGELIPVTQEVEENGEKVQKPIPGSVREIDPAKREAFRAELEELHSERVEVEYTPLALERYLDQLDERGVDLSEVQEALTVLVPWAHADNAAAPPEGA